jgi:hypothetical protein
MIRQITPSPTKCIKGVVVLDRRCMISCNNLPNKNVFVILVEKKAPGGLAGSFDGRGLTYLPPQSAGISDNFRYRSKRLAVS